MALHGGGHLELKKMHKGDFWGLFGIRLGRCPGIIPEKISFLQFYSSCTTYIHDICPHLAIHHVLRENDEHIITSNGNYK